MSRAWCLVRDQPVYRRDAFISGLKAAGYSIAQGLPINANPGDVCVGWNRYGSQHDLACQFEKRGGIYICAENGYVGLDRSNRQIYALAIGYHNGRGKTPQGDGERWKALGVDLKVWKPGNHVLVSANRCFGTPGAIMDANWMIQVRDMLKRYTSRPVKFRAHPGNDAPRIPFAADLAGAHAVVIWSSSTGCDALIAGVPVFCMAPWWICKSATQDNLKQIESAELDYLARQRAFELLAHAQYTVPEIASGMAFKALLEC